MIVIIPIGAVARRMPSAHHTDVDKNCFVISSPKRVNKGAKLENALFWKFEVSTVGMGFAAVAAVVGVGVGMISEMSCC
jgi:hypothetical protein